jgi:two-component system cell cycle response regulator
VVPPVLKDAGGSPTGRVLLVLNDADEAAAVGESLAALRVETLTAADGITGVALVSEAKPDLVLCSRRLPKMGGLELCRLVKRNHRLRHVPVLILLDEGDDSAVVSSLEVGANDYLVRPLDIPELIAAVRSHLQHVTSIARLEDDNKELATILEIAEMLTSTLSSSDLGYIIVQRVAEALAVDSCSLLRVDPTGQRATTEASTDPEGATGQIVALSGLPDVQRCLRTAKMTYVEDGRRDAELAGTLPADVATSVLAVPLQIRRGGEGRMVFRVSRAGEPLTYREIKFCQIVTTVAGNALENAALFESLEEAHLKLTEIARRDPLTGIFNRGHLFERLDQAWDRARRKHLSLSCILIDVDHFKRINDDLGHQCGDQVLIALGAILQDCVRGQDFVGRYGGEEFLVVLPETDRAGAVRVAERIRSDVHCHSFAGVRDRDLTVSLGVAVAEPGEGEDGGLERLVGRADQALYRAKQGGRDRVVVAEAEPAVATDRKD